ncbi:MAG: SusC/RagA family TonB-linked outer membrane protein [Gemmatimonadaceae bacterium]|nr:SusC/RagA family TonB-linked outer membrane protein [Gemmatimonadaceae bacterium]
MKTRFLLALLGIVLVAAPASAQQKTVTGTVTDERGAPLTGASVVVRGTTNGTITGNSGTYSIRAVPGQVLQFRFLGTLPVERTVGAENVINVLLRRGATTLDAVVVTALGQTTEQRALGTAQQTVQGTEIAQTQRENFVNALQGRVAGVEVISSSGVPGASSSITIRGVSSISSSNQPLMVIDGLPMDNKTLNSGVLASDAPGSSTAFSNRGVDFTNRAADLNPEDIETLTVLKGPEAAALYGIDAANGAIVITTKRGKPGTGGMDYSNRFRIENVRTKPDLQRTYGPTTTSGNTIGSFSYFGNPYPAGTPFYDNIAGFFQTGVTQTHNLIFSGAAPDARVNYRVASSLLRQAGVIPNSTFGRINVTGASGAQVNKWLKTDLSMQYTYTSNDQPYKGSGGPLLGLMLWPQTDDARDYLTPGGIRRRITNLAAASEVDNPYFNVDKNKINSKNNRIVVNLGLIATPFSWGDIQTKLGSDGYTNQNVLLRHPESAFGLSNNGILDQADDITRNLSSQTLVNLRSRPITNSLSMSALVGNAITDFKSTVDALNGKDFLDPNFVSVNNTNLRTSRTSIAQSRRVSAFGQVTADYKRYLYLTVTGRNDWTSTIPEERNSFFYPSINGSFIFSDAFPSLGRFMTGKLRAGVAEVGKDARPYAYRPSLEYKTTSGGGYGFGFTGPNPGLKPEFKQSMEIGTELSFLDDRLGLDVTVYRSQTKDQIVNDIRSSYATGFILLNLNGAETRNQGLEVQLRMTPIQRAGGLTWDVNTNFASSRGKTTKLPNEFPEAYVSDTWLFGNVRNGTAKGLSTMSLTGAFYRRNDKGELLIDPTTGLPLSNSTFIDAGYDRQPNWTMGVNNSFKYKRAKLDFLLDFRRGGDVFNATEQFLTARGLSSRTLDRDKPRVVAGVLRDGKENSDNPTRNTIVVVPSVQTGFYTGISEELFIEKNINWIRLRDVTLTLGLPARIARNASVFVTGTDLFLFTNYSGLDPIVNGTSASVGGSGGVGIDYGNFPVPRGLNFGLRMGF